MQTKYSKSSLHFHFYIAFTLLSTAKHDHGLLLYCTTNGSYILKSDGMMGQMTCQLMPGNRPLGCLEWFNSFFLNSWAWQNK